MSSGIYRSWFLIGLLTLTSQVLISQETPGNSITLDEVLDMASLNSLDAFKAKRKYGSGYWNFRSFQAKLLPKVNLELEPFTYTRSFVRRYDPIDNVDVYRQQQNVNTFAQLSISQNIKATGATVYINSIFNRLENFGDQTIRNFSTTPVRIGLTQPLMAFNELKWEQKTAELDYDKTRKEYLLQQQEIFLKGVSLFFQWALADTKVKFYSGNVKNTLRLFNIGKKRYDLGSIEKDELLNLELEAITSEVDFAKAKQDRVAVINQLQLFLGIEDLSNYTPKLPEVLIHRKIKMEDAMVQAQRNNPELLDVEIRKVKSMRDLDKAIKENRFEISLSASYGLNQQAEDFARAYSNFLDQQLVAINLSLPLLDWGERKGNIHSAKMNKEVTDIEIEQDRNSFEQKLQQTVNNFNLQENQVMVTLKTRDIAIELYELTEERFLLGKVDLLSLLNARSSMQNALENYVESLQRYWEYYYEVQKLTLYDFEKKSKISADFEKILED